MDDERQPPRSARGWIWFHSGRPETRIRGDDMPISVRVASWVGDRLRAGLDARGIRYDIKVSVAATTDEDDADVRIDRFEFPDAASPRVRGEQRELAAQHMFGVVATILGLDHRG